VLGRLTHANGGQHNPLLHGHRWVIEIGTSETLHFVLESRGQKSQRAPPCPDHMNDATLAKVEIPSWRSSIEPATRNNRLSHASGGDEVSMMKTSCEVQGKFFNFAHEFRPKNCPLVALDMPNK
jgi:hypothetical protein